MTNNHKWRLGKLELRASIEIPGELVFDWEQLRPDEPEILDQAGSLLERSEREYLENGGIVPVPASKAYRMALLRSMSDEELELMEQAATIMERIEVVDNPPPHSPG